MQPSFHRHADKSKHVAVAVLQPLAVHLGNASRDVADVLMASFLHAGSLLA